MIGIGLSLTNAALRRGGGGGAIVPPPVDVTPPIITSTAAHSVDENAPYATVATADEAVTWTKGGADAALVTLNAATGAWSIGPQDFETKPSLSFTLTARDQANNASAAQAVTITINDVAASPISSVDANGWSAQWASGTPPTFTPDSAPVTQEVSRAGFDATGAATSYTTARTFTRRQRQVYPNQAQDTAATVALDEYVYASDAIVGVTNNSVEISPKPVAAWAMPARLLVGNSVRWEIVAFHCNFRMGRQVAAVRVRGNDGTNQTPWQLVAATAISTLCEDANPIEVYGGDLDVTALATGAFWLEAEVFPWIGLAASVLRSEDVQAAGGGVREFTRRLFVKNVARAAAPPLAYVASTGSDTTGVWSTDPATASATPFLTVSGALTAATEATRGTPATGGSLDGCRIRVKDAVALGTGATARPQMLAAVIVERDPSVARAAAAVTLGAAFRPRLGVGTLSALTTEGALTFRDVTVSRTVNTTFSGETANPLQVSFWNVALTNGGTAGTMLANANAQWFGVAFTGFNGNLGQTANQHRIMRGLVVDFANGNPPEGWVTIGCRFTRVRGVSVADPSKGAIWYNNAYVNPDSTTAPIEVAGLVAGGDLGPIAVIQNLIEVTHTTLSTPALRLSSDDPAFGNITHAVVSHNTITGYGSAGRSNIFYDDTDAQARNHRLIRDVGNIYVQLNSKGDVFQLDGTRTGQFAYAHGVGCQGNWSMFRTGSATPHSETQTYPGLGSNIGASPTVRNDPGFVNYQGTGGAGGAATAGAGGGTYALTGGSAARGLVAARGLSFDLAGAPRPTTDNAAGTFA